MRIIDADKLIADMEIDFSYAHYPTYYTDIVDAQPTIDAKPVIRGHWKIWDEDYGNTFECSECGEVFYLVDGTPKENNYKYCPNCGALLDEEVEQ